MSSCLNLKRLLPPKRVWKAFTRKLPLRLHKPNRSKAIRKPQNRPHKTVKKHGWPPSLSIKPKKFKIQPNLHTLIYHQTSRYHCQKRAPPVFVDQLFIEPTVSVVEERVDPPLVGANKENSCPSSSGKSSRPEYSSKEDKSELVGDNKEKSCPSSSGKSSHPEYSSEEDKSAVGDHSMITADDMWESVAMASPQMHGINERAEEFIARFRAEMRQQEMRARHL